MFGATISISTEEKEGRTYFPPSLQGCVAHGSPPKPLLHATSNAWVFSAHGAPLVFLSWCFVPALRPRRFYGLSAKLSEAFTNDGKDLVLQLSIKNEQKLDCGGAYIKLTGDIDQDSFGGDSPYQVCGVVIIWLLNLALAATAPAAPARCLIGSSMQAPTKSACIYIFYHYFESLWGSVSG